MVVGAPVVDATITIDDRGGYGGDGDVPAVPGHSTSGGGGGGGGFLVWIHGVSATPIVTVAGGHGGVGKKLDPGAPTPQPGGDGGAGIVSEFVVGP